MNTLAKPNWLKVKLPSGEKYNWIKNQSVGLKLATVCQEAKCPNIGECWSSGTATFMVMGDTCTRGCKFCNVKTGKNPGQLDSNEPLNLANTIKQMDLSYIVITSVDRDDLPDQGATHISNCIKKVKELNDRLLVEILRADFQGRGDLINQICLSNPEVIAHNVETVPRLTRYVRDRRANYNQSLHVLDFVKKNYSYIYTKSSIMVGLGETKDEVIEVMKDLRANNVDLLTIGQYLQPRTGLLSVKEYVKPEQFLEYEKIAKDLGFLYAACGPLVRSSYKAGEFFISSIIKKGKNNL